MRVMGRGRRIARAALIAVAVLLGLWIAACGLARKAVFPAPKTFSSAAPPGGELLTVKTTDGHEAHAFYWPPPPNGRLVAHFHGNAAVISADDDRVGALRAKGLGVALIEYRGYGLSGGPTPSEEGIYTDAAALLDALAEKGIGPDRVVLYGTSLGTGVASEMARRGKGRRLILVTPFTSLPAVAARWVPFLPVSLIVRDTFDTLGKAKAITMPTLVVHGTADEVVPYDMGVAVAEALHGELVTVPNGTHNGLLYEGPDAFRRLVHFAAE